MQERITVHAYGLEIKPKTLDKMADIWYDGYCESRTAYYNSSRYMAGIDLHENSRRGMHSIRHTFATNLLRHKIPLETIAEMLGHVGMSSVDVMICVIHLRCIA